MLRARMIHQNHAHQPGGNAEKVRPALPLHVLRRVE
jgi:hypothetical protein